MSDATGDVRSCGRNLTFGHRQRRASGGFAAAALCHNSDIPGAVERLPGEGGSGDGTGEGDNKTNRTNAIKAMNQILDVYETVRLKWTNCVQSLPHRSITDCS